MKFLFFALIAVFLMIWILLRFLRKRRFSALSNRPFPMEWVMILEQNVELYRRLPRELRSKLHSLINLFLEEKSFEGCAGLVVDDKIKLVVASLACIPLLSKKNYCYPSVSVILIYPSAYVGEESSLMGAQLIKDEKTVKLGEAWLHGTVVLSLEDLMEDAQICDGENVVIHEFAHQIDAAEGVFDFMAESDFSIKDISKWKTVMNSEFKRLREYSKHGISGVIDPYGAENEAEFFAVVTETFFTAPEAFRAEHPELYLMLKRFYMLDPARWKDENQPGLTEKHPG